MEPTRPGPLSAEPTLSTRARARVRDRRLCASARASVRFRPHASAGADVRGDADDRVLNGCVRGRDAFHRRARARVDVFP